MNSKIEARIEAVKLALNVEGVTSGNIIEVSGEIADFIIGSAELPDTYDSNNYLKEMVAKMASNLANSSSNEKADPEATEKA